MSAGPTINRFRSQQVVETPWDFITAVNHEFGNIAVDLAATDDNHKAPLWITPEQDTFTVNWAKLLDGRLGWLNPEFDPMRKWAAKCALEQQCGATFLMLSPASVATNWFWDSVQPYATVYCIAPRITFVGSNDPYPKDLILSYYCASPSHELQRWNWRESLHSAIKDIDGVPSRETHDAADL